MPEEEDGQKGCRPCFQLFKGGVLLYSSIWSPGDATPTAGEMLARAPWVSTTDSSARFSTDVVVFGDVLIRFFHLNANGRRDTMFRAAFHTGCVSLCSGVVAVVLDRWRLRVHFLSPLGSYHIVSAAKW